MQVIPYVGYSLYQLFLMFCFWSFVGWVVEVVDMTYETGEYQNRGFLNMPICPIEGLGVIMVTVFFRPISDTVIPLFIACTVLCTAFELFVGWGMEKLFNARWWDYSHMKFNFMGFICLRNSLFFGAGCVVSIRYIQPAVERAIDSIPIKIGFAFVLVMSILIAVDTFVSLMAVKKLNERFRRIDEISELMLSPSVKVGMKLASGTLKVKSNVDKIIDVKDNVVEKVQDVSSANLEKLRDASAANLEKLKDVGSEGIEKLKDVGSGSIEKLRDVGSGIKDAGTGGIEKLKDKSAANLEKLRAEYNRLINEKDPTSERQIKALISHKYSRSLSLVKAKLKNRFSKDDEDESSDIPVSETAENKE